MTRYVLAVVALTLVYALTLASFGPWDLLIGAGLSAALLFSFRRIVFEEKPSSRGAFLGRVASFVPLLAAVAREILSGSWEVFLVTAHLRKPSEPGIVLVPFGERSTKGVAVSAFITSLTPGTLLIEVDEEKRVMLIHAINAADPEAVREEQQEFYRRYQKKVFP